MKLKENKTHYIEEIFKTYVVIDVFCNVRYGKIKARVISFVERSEKTLFSNGVYRVAFFQIASSFSFTVTNILERLKTVDYTAAVIN